MPSFLWKYLIGGAAILALGIALKIQTSRLHEAQQERDTALQHVTQLQAAAKGKDATIASLQASVDQWKALATPAESATAAVSKLETEVARLKAAARTLRAREETEREDPDCAAILAIDLGVCPAHVRGMQDRAGSGLR